MIRPALRFLEWLARLLRGLERWADGESKTGG
jgi:hypothetical protein